MKERFNPLQSPRTVACLGLFSAMLPASGLLAGTTDDGIPMPLDEIEAVLEAASSQSIDFEAWAARQSAGDFAMLDDPDGDDDDDSEDEDSDYEYSEYDEDED